jgi:hypothetical protein
MSNMKSTDRYLLLFRSADWYEGLPEAKVREIVADWMDWYQRLTNEGVVEKGNALAPAAKIVGAKDVSDGPFAESKETVGGYFIVRAKSVDEAVAVAKQCTGMPYGIRVEVREMLETCPFGDENAVEGKLAAASAYYLGEKDE